MGDRDATRLVDTGAMRFHLAVQRSRLAVVLLIGAVAGVARWTGLVEFDLVGGVLLATLGLVSVPVFMALHRRVASVRGHQRLAYGWMLLDIGFTCWSIYLIRDSSPLWLVWFLTNTTAAAFVAGKPAARLVMWTSCAAYLTLLVGMGKVQGLDRELALAVGRLTLLFGGSYFMVRGIGDLRQRRRQIAALHEERGAQLLELQRLTEELDRRGRELGEANLRSQEANRAKSQFLANMSHELRTPLNSIIGFSEILGEKLEGRIEPRFSRFLANILASGRHLLALINDILDLSKIEAGKMELNFETVSIADVAHGVASVMHGMAVRRRIELRLELAPDLPLIVADPPRLKQILYNLASNAVKFSAEGQTVWIRARPASAAESGLDQDGVELEVVDRGIGIRHEDQRLIFEEFRQADGGTAHNMGGTGLGLALVKRFAQMHGGRVRVESAPGQGSRFQVFLPLDASTSLGRRAGGEPISFNFPVSEVRPLAPPVGATVLVAEDDDVFFRALAADLESVGYRVRRARDGEEALALAGAERPAAISLDLVLPGVDGWEVLKRLKGAPDTADIPVIIVSLVANHELGFALGADDYFVKPLDRERFLARLRELAPPDRAVERLAVLVIDDDPQIHDVLELELTEAGYEMVSAASGVEGLALAGSLRPAVIVLDLVMDGVDGFQTAAELKRRPETSAIPILVFTSRDLSRDDRKVLAGSVAGMHGKATEDRRRLLDAIRELTGRDQQIREEHDRTADLGD